MNRFAVNAIGSDRPGIVAGLTRVLLEVEGNIEDSRMAILGGQFAVMLIVTVPAAAAASFEGRLAEVGSELGLAAISVNEIDEVGETEAATHVLTVYGADHPGIVHAVSSTLAECGANITDLQTRLAGDGGSPLYMIVMEIAVGGSVGELSAALDAMATKAVVEVSLRELSAEVF